jgi:hypothetical protein
LRAGAVVLDAAYRPRETPLLRAARAAGAHAVEGAEMLLVQGLAANALWTGRARAGGGGGGDAGAAAAAASAVYGALEEEGEGAA